MVNTFCFFTNVKYSTYFSSHVIILLLIVVIRIMLLVGIILWLGHPLHHHHRIVHHGSLRHHPLVPRHHHPWVKILLGHHHRLHWHSTGAPHVRHSLVHSSVLGHSHHDWLHVWHVVVLDNHGVLLWKYGLVVATTLLPLIIGVMLFRYSLFVVILVLWSVLL